MHRCNGINTIDINLMEEDITFTDVSVTLQIGPILFLLCRQFCGNCVFLKYVLGINDLIVCLLNEVNEIIPIRNMAFQKHCQSTLCVCVCVCVCVFFFFFFCFFFFFVFVWNVCSSTLDICSKNQTVILFCVIIPQNNLCNSIFDVHSMLKQYFCASLKHENKVSLL